MLHFENPANTLHRIQKLGSIKKKRKTETNKNKYSQTPVLTMGKSDSGLLKKEETNERILIHLLSVEADSFLKYSHFRQTNQLHN